MIEDYSKLLDITTGVALLIDLILKVLVYSFSKHENKKPYNLFYYGRQEIIILTRDRKYIIPHLQNLLSAFAICLMAFYLFLDVFIVRANR